MIQIRHLVEVAIVEDDARVIASPASALASSMVMSSESATLTFVFSPCKKFLT